MKAIENLSLFHREKYHQRYFMLEFGKANCFFLENAFKNVFNRKHRQVNLTSCDVLDDEEIKEKVFGRERKR